MESSEVQSGVELNEYKFETALARLKSMKERVADLRVQCESLRKLQIEESVEKPVCSYCGEEIEDGQQVKVKGSLGNPISCYHRDCFKELWVSEDWRLGYSPTGFLRMSKYSP